MKVNLYRMSVQSTSSESKRITSSLPVFIFVLFVPLICLSANWMTLSFSAPTIMKAAIAQVYLGSLITVWFWSQRNMKDTTLCFSHVTLLLSGMFFLGTLSVFWALNGDFYIAKWLMWYTAAIVFCLGLKVEQNEKNLSIIFNCFVVAGTVTSLIGMAQYLFSFSWLILQDYQPASTFGNINMAGGVMVLLFPFPLFFLFSNKTSKTGVWAYSTCLALMLSYAFISWSVAVWLSCLFEILLITMMLVFDGSKRRGWFFWNRHKTLAALFSILFFLLLTNPTTIGINPVYKSGDELVGNFSKTLSSARSTEGPGIAPRYMLIKDSIEMIKENAVIGSGLGSFYEKFNNGGANHLRMIGSQQVHNDTLELGIELGLVGLGVLIAIGLSLCSCLLVILKYSEGANRLGALLLTSAVAGVLLDAQFSFPFQVLSPLVITALLVAMLTRSAQQYSPSQVIKKVQVGSRFQKISFLLSASVLFGIVYLNSQWIKEYDSVSESFGNGSQLDPYIVKSKVMNPEIIPLLRMASQTSYNAGRGQDGLNYLYPLIDFWPTAPVHAILAAGFYERLQNIEENEKWARVLVESQPKDSFLGELILVEVYNKQGNIEGVKEIYNKLRRMPNEFILGHPAHLASLITLSVILKDEGQPPLYYERYIEAFPTTVRIETIMAAHYYNLEQYGRSLPHMRRTLSLDPDTVDAAVFKETIDKYGGSSIDLY
jgi:O-antigen ligase/tetratricopeptide (TPR) repeat protein